VNTNSILNIKSIDEENKNEEVYKYEYGFTILLNYPNDEGLMDSYINDNSNDLDKPRNDPSDWFNYGLDEEKWIKFLNKSILMHYEKNLILQQQSEGNEKNKNTQKIYQITISRNSS